ncbi:hypothetical protein KC19_VG070800, partial [Ceratodon purpureus]
MSASSLKDTVLLSGAVAANPDAVLGDIGTKVRLDSNNEEIDYFGDVPVHLPRAATPSPSAPPIVHRRPFVSARQNISRGGNNDAGGLSNMERGECSGYTPCQGIVIQSNPVSLPHPPSGLIKDAPLVNRVNSADKDFAAPSITRSGGQA